MKKQTNQLEITEYHLLLPMIWEGDLNLHSNKPIMENSSFRQIILHGDTIFHLATSLIEKQESPFTHIQQFSNSYKKSVSVGDTIHSTYELKCELVNSCVYKGKDEWVMEGSLTFSKEGRNQ